MGQQGLDQDRAVCRQSNFKGRYRLRREENRALGLVRLHSDGLSPCDWNPIWKLLRDDSWRAQGFYLCVREFCIPPSILPTNIDPKQSSLLAIGTPHPDITSQAVPRLQGGSDTGKYVHRPRLFP